VYRKQRHSAAPIYRKTDFIKPDATRFALSLMTDPGQTFRERNPAARF
jgi:hypothetical protein